MDGSEARTFCGTTQYLAPEVIKKEGYTRAVDWWALGVLIYEMVVGQPPFSDLSMTIMMEDILYMKFKPKDWFSKPLKDLLLKLLDKNPLTRLGSPETGGAQAIKAHPFFAGIDW